MIDLAPLFPLFTSRVQRGAVIDDLEIRVRGVAEVLEISIAYLCGATTCEEVVRLDAGDSRKLALEILAVPEPLPPDGVARPFWSDDE